MTASPIARADITIRIVTLAVLLLATLGAQVFVIPTFAAIYARDGLALPLGARIANGTIGALGHPLVALALAAGLGYCVWKRLGDASQRLSAVGLATLVFALVLVGQASVLLHLAIVGFRIGMRG